MDLRPLTTLGARLFGFLRFDPAAWRDLQTDPNAPAQALVIVILASIAAAVGAVGGWQPVALKSAVIGELGQWAACAGFAYFFGITLFRQSKTASFLSMLPLFGFAQAPQAIGLFGVVPAVGPVAGFVGIGFFFVYVAAALRIALGFDLPRAVANAAAGFLLAYAMLAGAFVSNGFDAAAFGSVRPLAARLPKPPLATPHPVAVAIGRNPATGAVAPQSAPKPIGSGRHPRHARVARPTAIPATATASIKARRSKTGNMDRGKATPTAQPGRPGQ
ncbi:MAG TPA: hypothetical protein VFQ80_11900 [Thermomicrobiales bacterium]|jgi:hypothetical protein|nr:hypothetical protein [Thermomicrobiales bacterium]